MPTIYEGLCQIQQNDACTICGGAVLDDGWPMVVVESGKMIPMRRDPSFLRFTPDYLSDELQVVEDALIDVFHAECLVSCVEGDWGKFGPQQCDGCEASFLKDIPRWAFRLRIGNAPDCSGIFVAAEDPANNAILCPDCFDFYLGNEELYEGYRTDKQIGGKR